MTKTRVSLALLLALLAAPASTQTTAATAALIEISGPIGPATSGYFDKAYRQAVDNGAHLIVLRIDTPGGLDTAMRDIVKQILGASIPVIGYVAPGGARAASAGTYILYACHVAAMAPATNLGAATPVPVSGASPMPSFKKKAGDEDAPDRQDAQKRPGKKAAKPPPPEEPEALPEAAGGGDAMQHKIINDAVAYIRSLAEKRGRNADWAERAVREGVSLSSEQALKQKVIDLIADDTAALLKQVDGRSVSTAAGEVKLATAGLVLQKIEPDWRMQFLSIITSPTVAYILLLIGIYGLLLEGYHPGAILPGVAGGICMLLALYAFQLLPVNYVGLLLILLGVALMIGEALAPGFGALGFGGIAAFVIGSIMLLDIDVPGYNVNVGIIAGIAVSAATVLGLTLYLLWRARRAPVVTGQDGLLGQTAELLEPIESEGWARVLGERWRVRVRAPLKQGAHARVAGRDGLTLIVEPIDSQ